MTPLKEEDITIQFMEEMGTILFMETTEQPPRLQKVKMRYLEKLVMTLSKVEAKTTLLLAEKATIQSLAEKETTLLLAEKATIQSLAEMEMM